MPSSFNEHESGRPVTIAVSANLLGQTPEDSFPDIAVYAFSSGGSLLAHAPVNESGEAALALPSADVARSVRVLVGPQLKENVSLPELDRRGAKEIHVRIDPHVLAHNVSIVLNPDVWRCWLSSLCFVQGTLLKQVLSGGIAIDAPVCNATVEVYEVEPWYVILNRIPDEVLEVVRTKVIDPSPPPPPDEITARTGFRSARLRSPLAAAVPTGLSVSSLGDLHRLAQSTDTTQFRQGLAELMTTSAAISDSIVNIFCLVYPIFVTERVVATAETDGCGHFSTLFFRGCLHNGPTNLYFKATQLLFGIFPITIYAPTPIACHTYWNYQCGSEVTLHTTNPFAVTCKPCPPVIAADDYVIVYGIGDISMHAIRGSSASLQPTTTPANQGLTAAGAPFGELIRPRMEFDNRLRDDLNVRYYQMSWRKGTTGSFTPMSGEVHRHFRHVVAGSVVVEGYPLGPTVVNGQANLFEIPPALPPIGEWSLPDPIEDSTSAKFATGPAGYLGFPSAAAEQGKYQLKIDLFDASGVRVDIDALGIHYVVPNIDDLSTAGMITTDEAAPLGLVFDADGSGRKSFVMTLHIDNQPCAGTLDPAQIGATHADGCGVLNYSSDADNVTINYSATHPNGFATHTFRLTRGVTPLLSESGGTGTFAITKTVGDLRCKPPTAPVPPGPCCPVAGYAEDLYVAAMATNGWSRLSQYDASPPPIAFVLAPTP